MRGRWDGKLIVYLREIRDSNTQVCNSRHVCIMRKFRLQLCDDGYLFVLVLVSVQITVEI